MAYSEWRELKKGLKYLKASYPYLLSHHPLCRYYDGDVLHVGKWRVCWGCIVTYPTMLCAIAAIVVLGLHHELSWWQFMLSGLVLGSFELISLWRKGRGLRHRTIKFFLGLGLASMTIGVFSIPVHLVFRMLIFIQLYIVAGMLGSFRIVKMEKKCRRCPWKGNWFRCPGFRELNERLGGEGPRSGS
ncbi:MAG: hypothetical protein JXA22_08590 [Candidatus Thermoplasmatota archaeon]|nr:hypothetical protein [Candidatus Thermoplasmatota archaeon]